MKRFLFAIVWASLLLVGCRSGEALPKTYPAGGQVFYNNGQPMKGGSVLLLATESNSLRVFGVIGEDGKFSLTTLRDRKKAAGAPAGEYRVEVQPPLKDEHRGLPPLRVPGTYKIEAKDDNQLAIRLDTPPP